MEKDSYRVKEWASRLTREDWIRICQERLTKEESALLWEKREKTPEITQKCLDLLVKAGLIRKIPIELWYIV